jgi:phosphoribosylanthranilate isomerase
LADLRIKVCGVTRAEDARHAAAAGADFIGAFLSPGFPRTIEPRTARSFTNGSGPLLVAVLVNETTASAAALAQGAGASVLQLHGDESPAAIGELRDAGPWRVWKAIRPRTADDLLRGIADYSGSVDAILLDGWHPAARGGTGVRVSWDLVASLRAEVPDDIQLILAGGLTPENVSEAIRRVSPDVVDVSSGVEAQVGRKDPARVERFIQAAREAS